MTRQNIASMRLAHQQIAAPVFTEPGELVEWMGCLQSQDYAMAKWAIGCRLARAVTDGAVEKAFNEGKILRTHVLRPTWHFVAPKDIRWMLALTAPRIKAFARAHHRQLEIDAAILKRSSKILEKVLSARGPLTRKELQEALADGKIKTDASRMGFLLLDAELDGSIVSAGKKGKQLAYGLLEEIVPEFPRMKKEESLAELAWRYFTSHGPATVADFAWWSGLLLTDAKKGMVLNESRLVSEKINGKEYWWGAAVDAGASAPGAGGKVARGAMKIAGAEDGTGRSRVHLLPAFDEFFISYKDRSDLVDKDLIWSVMTTNGIFNPILVVKNRIAGLWKRIEEKGRIGIGLQLFDAAGKIPEAGLAAAIREYGEFCGKPAERI